MTRFAPFFLIFAALLGCQKSDPSPNTQIPQAQHWQESEAVAQLFRKAGVRGTFVVYDAAQDRFRGHNLKRARQRFIPASTFKIPNSLIGLSTGAVSSADEVLPYGGKPQMFDIWEQDMGLRDAIRISNVPIYQELARRIGLKRMREGVEKLGFGNHDIGDSVDTFWLEGPLKISALEQCLFLVRLAAGQLPIDQSVQQTVRDMVQIESGEDWHLYGKTGWATSPDPDVGWWVGWVQGPGGVHAFALNIDMLADEDRGKRVELGKNSLRVLGIL